jgi:hypothetical protein
LWWNWHDEYAANAAPDTRSVEVLDSSLELLNPTATSEKPREMDGCCIHEEGA